EINAFDILSSVELSLFEPAEQTVEKASPEIEKTISGAIFKKLDETVKEMLQKISLLDLTVEVEKNKNQSSLMFYI
ncbi:MAG TPA: Rrf2 family transcriptional regulator, partial [Ruminococcaceae bacterium]|nr:Rrf2 family transcriptional regulator [Oscillospiraceae bacterium]